MPTGFLGILRQGFNNDASAWIRNSNPFAQPYQVNEVKSGGWTLQALCGGPSEKLPSMVFDRQDAAVIFAGSVYNKDELLGSLACAGQVTDAELVYTAWHQWGDETPLRLNGDWMFAVYEKMTHKLILVRSWGYNALYYRREGTAFAFATNLRALVDMEGKRVNPDYGNLMLVLCAAGVPGSSDSPYEGIFQLPPASILRYLNGQIDVQDYWRPSLEHRLPAIDEKSALEQFTALYTKAVKLRLAANGDTGATLSAGLDSGSVCALAAGELGRTGKTLHAWTSVPRYHEEAFSTPGSLSDERLLAANVVKGFSNVKHYLLDSEQSNPIRSVCRQAAFTGRPQWSGGNYYWLEDVLSEAAAADCSVVLLGQVGNSTVSWSPRHIPLLPKKLFFPETPWNRYLTYPVKLVRAHLKTIKKELPQKMRKLEEIYPLVNPALLHSDIFRRIRRDDAWRPSKEAGQAALQELFMGMFDVHYHMGFQSGAEFRDPTMDIELTRFLLTLPESMYFRDGMDRRVLRLGTRGILPDENRLNRRRGHQGADILPRIRAHIDYAERTLAYMGRSALAVEVINLTFMQSILNRLKSGETNAQLMRDCTKYLLPGFSCGVFLADYDLKSRFDY